MTTISDAFGNPLPLSSNEQKSETATKTAVMDETHDDSQEEVMTTKDKSDELYIPTPIFLLFAEFLGFASYFISLAEDWCNPKKKFPSATVKTFLEREARTIYDEMLGEYSEEEIHDLYKNFYACGLDELESDLNEKIAEATEKEGLPF